MPRVKKQISVAMKAQQLGIIYRLVEQFELISRIDLSKLSGFAPASITELTRQLIQANFVMERTVQTNIVRGRPAIGLCLSPFYWRTICATLLEDSFEISLCELNDNVIKQMTFVLTEEKQQDLAQFITQSIGHFLQQIQQESGRLLAVSVVVAGELHHHGQFLKKLGRHNFDDLDLLALFEPHFPCPILLNEYFQTWIFAESSLGSAINSHNVLFLQLDDVINMSVLIKGEPVNSERYTRMNINKVAVPAFSELHDLINQDLSEVERHQLYHQVTHHSIYQLVDKLFPQNALIDGEQKIRFVCEQAKQGNENAIKILYHIADSVSYVLMNLINIFSSEKIIISSSLLAAKEIFLPRLQQKLKENLLLDNLEVAIGTSHYALNSPIVASSAIKKHIYNGDLLKNLK
ncbi:ROK family protein [Volucribacter amazonae]|uniref:Transcriptional regulator n=1 Tax=Volucribacter amazonae TaxID=256731 RepID=A0A9X4SKM7_9PAST|nr:ROK family protein [Volucribacter amazonae]MDG6894178.1 transcriptional regulator [Volucribacter amazonae]